MEKEIEIARAFDEEKELSELLAMHESNIKEMAKARESELQGLMDKDYEITKRIAKELGIEEFGTACAKDLKRFRKPVTITTNSSRSPKEEE